MKTILINNKMDERRGFFLYSKTKRLKYQANRGKQIMQQFHILPSKITKSGNFALQAKMAIIIWKSSMFLWRRNFLSKNEKAWQIFAVSDFPSVIIFLMLSADI